MIQDADLTAEDFGGEEYEGCNEYLTRTAPQVIQRIHEEYLQQVLILLKPIRLVNIYVLDEYDLGHLAYELNIEAVKLACAARDKYSMPNGLGL